MTVDTKNVSFIRYTDTLEKFKLDIITVYLEYKNNAIIFIEQANTIYSNGVYYNGNDYADDYNRLLNEIINIKRGLYKADADEPFDITKDLVVRMKDGSLYIYKDINWGEISTTGVCSLFDDFGDTFIDSKYSEYINKFSEVISLGDLSTVDYKVNMYGWNGVNLPYIHPNNHPVTVNSLARTNIPPTLANHGDSLEFSLEAIVPSGIEIINNDTTPGGIFYCAHFNDLFHTDDVGSGRCSYRISFPNATELKHIFAGSTIRDVRHIKLDAPNVTKTSRLFSATKFENFPIIEDSIGTAWAWRGNCNIDLSHVTDASEMFYGAYISGSPVGTWNDGIACTDHMVADFTWFNFGNVTNADCMFQACHIPAIRVSLPKVTNLKKAFQSYVIERLYITNLGPCTSSNAAFLNGNNIKELEINALNVLNLTSFFVYPVMAEHIYITNLGITADFSNAPRMSVESVKKMFDTLQSVTGKTITLNTHVYEKLPANILNIAIGKQWVVTHKLGSTATEEAYKKATALQEDVEYKISNKVDKEEGKQLSTEDFTTELKNNIENEIPELIESINYELTLKADIDDLSNVVFNEIANLEDNEFELPAGVTLEQLRRTLLPKVVHCTTTTKEINSNTYYIWDEVDRLNITFAEPFSNEVLNEYMIEFVSGDIPTILKLPEEVLLVYPCTIESNTRYQISIINNIGIVVGV